MAGSLHSGHRMGSNWAQKDCPPPGNKSPNSRAANRARNKEREEGGREEKEEEEGLGPPPVGKRLKRGKEREGKA